MLIKRIVVPEISQVHIAISYQDFKIQKPKSLIQTVDLHLCMNDPWIMSVINNYNPQISFVQNINKQQDCTKICIL